MKPDEKAADTQAPAKSDAAPQSVNGGKADTAEASPRDQTAASQEQAGPAKLPPLDVTKTHAIAEFKHELALTTLRVDPTARMVAAGAEDLDIQLWDLDTGRHRVLQGHSSWVRSLDFSADGRQLFSACWGGEVKIWNTDDDTPQPVRTLAAHQGAARFVRVSPDGQQLATCGNDLLVKLWEIESGKLIHSFAGHQRHVYGVDFHPAGQHLVSQDLMGQIFVWDLETGGESRRVDGSVMTGYDNKFAADMGGARDMQFRPDGNQWASAGITKVTNSFAGIQEPIIVLFDWASGKEVKRLQSPDKNVKGIAWGVRYHDDGFVIGAIADRSGKGEVWFYPPDKDAPLHTLKLPSAARGLDLLSDQRRLAIAHADGHVRLYQMTEKAAGEADAEPAEKATDKTAG